MGFQSLINAFPEAQRVEAYKTYVACIDRAFGNTIRVVVRVQSPDPLSGVTVTVAGYSTTTRADGTAIVELPDDFEGTEVEIEATLPGFAESRQTVVARDGQIVTLDFNVGR